MRHEFKGWEEEEVMVSVMLLSVLFALLLPFPWQCKLRSWVYLLVVSTPFHISLSATESIRKETADQDFFFFSVEKYHLTVSEVSIKIYTYLLLLPYPVSWLSWQWRKLDCFGDVICFWQIFSVCFFVILLSSRFL